MIPNTLNVDDDMRGQCLGQGAFEKGDHRAEDTRRSRSAKAKVDGAKKSETISKSWNFRNGLEADSFGFPIFRKLKFVSDFGFRISNFQTGLLTLIILVLNSASSLAQEESKWRILL